MFRTKNSFLIRMPTVAAAAVFLPLTIAQAGDGEPTAIVDDVSDSVTSVELMDYLFPGQEIELGAGDTIMIGYLDSCVTEEITGGKIVIGAEQSDVTGGDVSRVSEGCGGTASVEAADDEAVIGLSAVFRAVDDCAVVGGDSCDDKAESEKPKVPVIYSQYPAVIADPNAMELVVQRLDKNDKPLSALMFGGKFDFARRNVSLAKGGMYRFTVGDHDQVVMISTGAGGDAVPVAKRLIRLD